MSMDLSATAKQLMHYVRPHWRTLAASVLFFTLGSAVEPVLPAMFKKLLDSGFKSGLKYPIWMVPAAVIGLFIVRGGLIFLGAYALNAASSQIVLNLRRNLMRAVLKADAKLFTHMSPGIAVTRILNDPQFAAASLGGALEGIDPENISVEAAQKMSRKRKSKSVHDDWGVNF